MNELHIDGYEILEQIGSGGFGSVYKARHLAMDQLVAIKVLHQFRAADLKELKRFQAEAKILALLDHPNIVKIHAFSTTADGTPFFVMEYIPGKTLSELRGNDPLSWELVLPIARTICSALAYAHEHGVIHYDLKQSNILIEGTLENFSALKIVDFGMAGAPARTQDVTQTRSIAGSAVIMSPEQWMGKKGDPRTDIYSLGCLLFDLVEGHPPYEGDAPLELAYKHQNQTIPPITKSVPNAVKHAINRALSKSPQQRQAGAKQFLDELEGNKTLHLLPRKRKLVPIVVTIAAAALVLTSLSFFTMRAQIEPGAIKSDRDLDYQKRLSWVEKGEHPEYVNNLGKLSFEKYQEDSSKTDELRLSEAARLRVLKLTQNKRSEEDLLQRLEALLSLGDLENAKEQFEAAEKFNKEARELTDKYFARTPKRADAYLQSASTYMVWKKDTPQQLAWLEEALKTNKEFFRSPSDQYARILAEQGKVFYEQKQYDKALTKLELCLPITLELDPDQYPARLLLLWHIYREKKDRVKADNLERALPANLTVCQPCWAGTAVIVIARDQFERGEQNRAHELVTYFLTESEKRGVLSKSNLRTIAEVESDWKKIYQK